MKILSAEQIREADQFTIKNEPISSIDLMERASQAFVSWFEEKYPNDLKVVALCGTGNNGGDGLAITRLLNERNHTVEVVVIGNQEKGSKDFKTNLERLKDRAVTPLTELPDLDDTDVLIDGLFGSGLSRPVEGHFAEVIEAVNQSGVEVVAIDIPSGLFCDQQVESGAIMRATHVVSFQVPKLSFFLPQHIDYMQDFDVVDIGLSESFISSLDSSYETIDKKWVASVVKRRPKFFHKGSAGRALIVSGHLGKFGASVLCARACLRSGVGLLEVHIPRAANTVLQVSVPEAMVLLDDDDRAITGSFDSKKYDVLGIGPGIDTEKSTVKALRTYLETYNRPVVLDADALNIISEHPEMMALVHPDSILTPHPGEFRRLVGDWSNDYERLRLQMDFSKEHGVIVILKNAHTSVSLPSGQVYFNNTGNPGMATAGSGDVLTGMIVGLMAQQYAPKDAALLGVFLHGQAGDLAAVTNEAEEAIIAGDIIKNIGPALGVIKQI